MRMYAWQRADESTGHSVARVSAIDGGRRYQGTEVLATPTAVSCTFTVDVTGESRPVRAIVRAFSQLGSRVVELTTDGWRWSIDGQHRPALDGATDVDVAATPLTNAIPIRRLGHLAVGEEAVMTVAWVDVPSLAVRRVEQTYTRLEPVDGLAAWQYGDREHGAFRLLVDADGVVVDYEGFATRVSPR
ncbi:glycolipid-binding family protein [Agrococcus sp. SGAir0287]|nr:glycolipid-binding family protein [Agrococcus sp. SGAir0287]